MQRDIVQPKTQIRRLELMGQATRSRNRRLTVTDPGLARQQAASQVFELVWTQTKLVSQFKPVLLAGYPDPMLKPSAPPPSLFVHLTPLRWNPTYPYTDT